MKLKQENFSTLKKKSSQLKKKNFYLKFMLKENPFLSIKTSTDKPFTSTLVYHSIF
jgi:hypothetical protein